MLQAEEGHSCGHICIRRTEHKASAVTHTHCRAQGYCQPQCFQTHHLGTGTCPWCLSSQPLPELAGRNKQALSRCGSSRQVLTRPRTAQDWQAAITRVVGIGWQCPDVRQERGTSKQHVPVKTSPDAPWQMRRGPSVWAGAACSPCDAGMGSACPGLPAVTQAPARV